MLLAGGQPSAGPEPPLRRGVMLIVSSPAGAGKTTLTRRLAEDDPEVALSVSATTRPRRPQEMPGVNYDFLTRSQFETQRDAGAFLEWAEVFGNLYGTPRQPVADALAQGRDVLFDVDWQGADQLAVAAPGDVVRVFILPPSRGEWHRRLIARAGDSEAVIARRLAGAAEEMRHLPDYDHVIVNRALDDAYAQLCAVLTAARLAPQRQIGLDRFIAALVSGEGSG